MENTERAWATGPFRRVGTGHGTPSKYICDKCLDLAITGVRLEAETGKWLCASCEMGKVRKTRSAQPRTGFLRFVDNER